MEHIGIRKQACGEPTRALASILKRGSDMRRERERETERQCTLDQQDPADRERWPDVLRVLRIKDSSAIWPLKLSGQSSCCAATSFSLKK
eukprot:2123836-Amphidinium_carterae.1